MTWSLAQEKRISPSLVYLADEKVWVSGTFVLCLGTGLKRTLFALKTVPGERKFSLKLKETSVWMTYVALK